MYPSKFSKALKVLSLTGVQYGLNLLANAKVVTENAAEATLAAVPVVIVVEAVNVALVAEVFVIFRVSAVKNVRVEVLQAAGEKAANAEEEHNKNASLKARHFC